MLLFVYILGLAISLKSVREMFDQGEVSYGKMNLRGECWYLYVRPPRSVPCPKTRSFFTKVHSAKVKNDLVKGQGTD